MDTKEQFAKLVDKVKWRFAWTYAKTLPHEYVVFDKNSNLVKELFNLFNQIALKQGITRKFGKRYFRYIFVNGFKFWRDVEVLNREWLKGYSIDFDKKTYKFKQ
ncbi:MAG: hypothetical protein QW156_04455 [Candidatus Aenigmatarchaeota archaeon]